MKSSALWLGLAQRRCPDCQGFCAAAFGPSRSLGLGFDFCVCACWCASWVSSCHWGTMASFWVASLDQALADVVGGQFLCGYCHPGG